MAEIDVEFVSNTPDDLHCFQAAVTMVYQALLERPLTLDEADALTGFVPGKPTWQFAGLLGLARAGLNVTDTELFSPEEFVLDPEASIRKQVGDEDTAAEIIGVSDLERERKLVEECLSTPGVQFENRIPTTADLISASRDALLICNVNYRALVEKDGYVGHFVVVIRADDDGVLLHDPGLPPLPNHRVTWSVFERAWRYPSESMANIISIRKTSGQE